MSAALNIALVGNPNCGKTALFNQLTGAKQKVANYAGVTVERKEGQFTAPSGRKVHVLDLPGTYSLDAMGPDEIITRDVCLGKLSGVQQPDLIVCVADATNLRLHLRFVLEIRKLGRPMVLALNMMDAAKKRGIRIDHAALQRELGVTVIETVAVRADGVGRLIGVIDGDTPQAVAAANDNDLHQEVRRILSATVVMPSQTSVIDDRLDGILLNPWLGLPILFAIMFVVFQAVFTWATPLMDGITAGVTWLAAFTTQTLPDGLLKDFLVNAVFGGLGSVIVFLPQIVILFFFILVLEESGYLPRAAFLLDRLMQGAGLTGRSFIPLLSSHACAIPGIMATRSIHDPRDRLTTILIAPLMTCSARPAGLYPADRGLLPAKTVLGFVSLQGLVLFGLYPHRHLFRPAGLVDHLGLPPRQERASAADGTAVLPPAQRQEPAMGLWERAVIFMKRITASSSPPTPSCGC